MFALILGIVILLSIVTVVIINKNPKMKTFMQIVYALIIIVLGYLLIEKIMDPIRFKKERKIREDATIERLKEIRTVQESYKEKYGKFTGSFDTLINFVKKDSFNLEKLTVLGEWNQDELTKEQAIKQGILAETITHKAVRDSLFTADYEVENIRYIPYTNKKEFIMGAGEVETGSQVKVKVFEAYALYDDLFFDLDRQEVINYKDGRYKITEFDGVKVGSLSEANNNAGNWEK